MSSRQLAVSLHSKTDKNGDEYFIGSIDAPGGAKIEVDLTKVTFVFFLPPEGETRGTLKIRDRGDIKPRDRETDDSSD
jgi:hypothetical protein